MQYPSMIAEKVFKMILANQGFLLLEHYQEIFNRVLDNLLGYSAEAHRIAMMILHMMSTYDYLNVCELLYGGKPWAEIEDTSS